MLGVIALLVLYNFGNMVLGVVNVCTRNCKLRRLKRA